MRGMGLNGYLITALICATLVVTSWQDPVFLASDDICRLLPDGAKIRKPGSCSDSVVCNNFVSTPGSHCERPKNMTLDLKCETVKSPTGYCKPPCTAKTSGFVADPVNCNGWYRCDGTKVQSGGNCPGASVFDSATQTCTDATGPCKATFELCDVVPAKTNIKDEDNCHKYFQCVKSKLTSLECVDQYYDARTGDCMPRAQVDCARHPVPVNACGTTRLPLRGRFVPDQATCRGYFFCRDLGSDQVDTNPTWGQCDDDRFFDAEWESCVPRARVPCNADRCDGRPNGREISQKRGCQHYLECSATNYTVTEQQCPDNMYFNVNTGQCQANKISYAVCA